MVTSTRSSRASKNAPKLPKRRPPSMFTPGIVEGKWSPFEAWLRLVLDFYMAYAEVKKPLLSADGTPKLDTFGRPSADPAVKEMYGIKKGAVWFTRETLRQAWFFQFGQNLNVLDYPEHYTIPRPDGSARGSDRDDAPLEAQNRTTINGQTKTRSITTHPMDPYVTRMVQDGRLIRKRGNHYMISEAMCEKLDRLDAWKTHKERGSRWEGLFYEERAVAASKVKVKGRRNRILDTDVIIFQEPVAGLEGMRHPNQIMWTDVRKRLANYLLFDIHTVMDLAVANGLMPTNPEHLSPVTGTHIGRWVKQGLAEKHLPGLYQTADFAGWDAGRNKFQLPQMGNVRDYIAFWYVHQAVLQGGNPNATFGAVEILDFFSTEAPAEWLEENLPVLPPKTSVNTRLSQAKKAGDIILAGSIGRFQLSPRLIDLFRPLWVVGVVKEPDHVAMYRWILELDSMEIGHAIDNMTFRDRQEVLFSQLGRIMKLDPIQQTPFLVKLSAKMRTTPNAMIKGYREYLDTIL